MTALEYTNWFHSKFINRTKIAWPNAKVDHNKLAEIIEKYNIKSVFEIGTWEGFTALFFWLHPQLDRVKTIDICEEYGHSYHNPSNGKYGLYLENTLAEFEKISSLDYQPTVSEQYDMVFIEGNHAYDFVNSDFKLAKKFNPKIIAFHDVLNGHHDIDKVIFEIVGENREGKFIYPDPGCYVGYYIV